MKNNELAACQVLLHDAQSAIHGKDEEIARLVAGAATSEPVEADAGALTEPLTVVQVNEWLEAERISDLPAVDEAIRDLLADPTGDNGTMVIREVLRSVAKSEPVAWMRPSGMGPEFTDDAALAGYWMRKGRTVMPLASQAAQPAPTPASDDLNGGMHASIFVKVWGDAGGGDAGRIALANYAYELGKRAAPTALHSGAETALAVEVRRGRLYICKGAQSFMLAYEWDTDEELNWYVGQLKAVLSIVAPCVNSGVAPDGGQVRAALEMAIRQNSHDMLMTGEEIRQCEAALATRPAQTTEGE